MVSVAAAATEQRNMSTMIIIVLARIFLMMSTLCAAFIIQQPYIISIYNTNCKIPSSRNNLPSASYRLFASSSTNNNNDDKDTTTTIKDELASHYTSKTVLSWLQKMTDSYQVEEGEELLTVLTREGSVIEDTDNDIDGDTYQLLKLAKLLCAQTNLSIASHDFLRSKNEAIYNYGNIAFLKNFGYEWDEFVELPSSKCVATQEDVNERQKLLDARLSNKVGSSINNDTDDTQYDNLIRVCKDGTQIVLKGVHLWNVYDITLQQQEEQEEDDNRSSTSEEVRRIRKQIEQGEIKAIGQAVWIQNIEPL